MLPSWGESRIDRIIPDHPAGRIRFLIHWTTHARASARSAQDAWPVQDQVGALFESKEKTHELAPFLFWQLPFCLTGNCNLLEGIRRFFSKGLFTETRNRRGNQP